MEPIPWLKDKLCGDREASGCRWAKIQALVNIGFDTQMQNLPSDLRLVARPSQPVAIKTPFLQGQPVLARVCTHEGLVGGTRQSVAQQISADLGGRILWLVTSLEICRACPFCEPEPAPTPLPDATGEL